MSYFTYQNTKIYYQESGSGDKTVVLLHGDTASSKMFKMILPLYQDMFKVIVIDFIGSGKSDRLASLPADLWIYQAYQVIALLEHLNAGKVSLIGTSGGAWCAINAALERPELVDKVVADSFNGRTLTKDFPKNLVAERNYAMQDPDSQLFYEWCQGKDWREVVERNTKALLECAKKELPLFVKPLEQLPCPILFVGTMEDEMCRKNLEEEYLCMQQLVSNGKIHIFEKGGHPAILSNAEEFVKVVKEFL